MAHSREIRELDRFAYDLSQLQWSALELDLTARDARDIQQIFDQAPEVADLALDDQRFVLERPFVVHECERGGDRCERVSQLVPEHG